MSKLSAVPSVTSLYKKGVPLYTTPMSVAEFAQLPRCQFQRNELLRLNKPHLRVLEPQHALVAIAVLPNGSIQIVDGHSRRAKWLEGSLEQPPSLTVAVYPVETVEQIERIYESYDNQAATKIGADIIQSGLAKANIALTTPWLMAGGMASSLALAALAIGKGRIDKKAQVQCFAQELTLFDSITPSRTNFIIGTGAAALLILRKHGALGLDFLKRFDANLGTKIGEEKDAVQMLTDFLKGERAARTYAGIENNKRHAAIMLALHGRHLTGKMNKRMPKPVDLFAYTT